ncbi:MAG: S8 family serine peptidase [Bacteroidales bacterium]|jgi:PKD repeat protein|nr:S8 family serine peptidase [Bacteroidales bacterium]
MRKIRFSGLIIVLVMLLIPETSMAQVRSRAAELRSFSSQRAKEYKARKAEAVTRANQLGIPLFVKTDKVFMELQYFESDIPIYFQTFNSNSAKTISTNKVLPGGSSGLNLDGSGITIREWDGGAVRLTHQEFGNRVVQGDGVTTTHYHAQHVAGTMIASGVNATAKGMAPAANLRAFDWNSDVSEMATEASNGALMSNHSYGYITGWAWNGFGWQWYGDTNVSTQEDYRFGFYNSNTKDYDVVAHNAPYYLIVKAAGNDRGDGPTNGQYPQDGPYDCIGSVGVAKNILTVGAVNDITAGYSQPSDVVMSSFSSWGPADDGRIKPDICANGVSLYSTDDDNDSDYQSLSGTSMATPSVTGSLALLQQHYQAKKGSGQFMKSATLKALAIHTADEAGPNVGPDYMFGWGLMNTLKAANKITEDDSNNVIDELSLSNGQSYTRTVSSDGTTPIRVTIVWNDVPPTNTPAKSLDPADPMLVNDLDITLTKGSDTFYPWKLDRNNPSAAATNSGKNSVDNVEVIDIPNPTSGSYVITVSHVGTLSGGSQEFSIILSGVSAQVLPEKPTANFTASPTSVTQGQTVTFTDASTNVPTSWSWTFTGGVPASSTDQNPTVTYNTPGTYTVTLNATNQYGTGTVTKTDYITVLSGKPVADFSASSTDIAAGGTVTFTDASTNTPTSWSWTFAGGTPASSSAQNPTVTYSTAGTYAVTLTATNSYGDGTITKNGYITVSDAQYCESKGGNITYEWIKKVTIGSFVKNSDAQKYSDFTSDVITLTEGQSINIELVPGYKSTQYNEYWKIWVDLNGDKDFDDPGELVYDHGSSAKNAVTGSFTIPTSATASTTRLRVVMSYYSISGPCGTQTYGETEDYKLNLIASSSNDEDRTGQGEKELPNTQDVIITPNPTNGIFTVNTNGGKIDKVVVYSVIGKLVKTINTKGDNVNVDISGVKSGVYYVKVFTVNGEIIKTIIKR